MKKKLLQTLILIFFILTVVSCIKDTNIKGIKASFNQFVNMLESENTLQLDMNMPFLSKMTIQEQSIILDPFRNLKNIKYTLEIIKKSETVYYLQIKTGNSESFWTDIFIPYEQNQAGQWIMAPVIKSVYTIDIIPAQN